MREADPAQLSAVLKRSGLDRPALVLDLDRLDWNIGQAVGRLGPGMAMRLVAKSLPSLDLLNHIRKRCATSGLMTFSGSMLDVLLRDDPDSDHLIGKPLPVTVAAEILGRHPRAEGRVQWLVDSMDRLRSYLALAERRGVRLRLSLEVDVGLHRGGFRPAEVVAAVSEIDASDHAELAGIMGYEAHLGKMPGLLKRRAERASDRSYAETVSNLGRRKGLCLNTGGSLTFMRYAGAAANEISLGSVLVKPSGFDAPATEGFVTAAFIATPVLKVMPGNPVPGIEVLARFRRRTDLAIHGGHFLAEPVHPTGFGYSSVFGRSSNQEVWSGPAGAAVAAGDIALLRPTQSEAVLNQFGEILALRGGEIVRRWPVLPN